MASAMIRLIHLATGFWWHSRQCLISSRSEENESGKDDSTEDESSVDNDNRKSSIPTIDNERKSNAFYKYGKSSIGPLDRFSPSRHQLKKITLTTATFSSARHPLSLLIHPTALE